MNPSKAFSAVLTSILLLASPGPSSYQAWAAQQAPAGSVRTSPANLAGVSGAPQNLPQDLQVGILAPIGNAAAELLGIDNPASVYFFFPAQETGATALPSRQATARIADGLVPTHETAQGDSSKGKRIGKNLQPVFEKLYQAFAGKGLQAASDNLTRLFDRAGRSRAAQEEESNASGGGSSLLREAPVDLSSKLEFNPKIENRFRNILSAAFRKKKNAIEIVRFLSRSRFRLFSSMVDHISFDVLSARKIRIFRVDASEGDIQYRIRVYSQGRFGGSFKASISDRGVLTLDFFHR